MRILRIHLKAYKFVAIAVLGFMNVSIPSIAQTFLAIPSDTLLVDTLFVDESEATVEYEFNVVAILPFYSLFIETEENPPTKRILKMRDIAVESLNGIRWAAERIRTSGYHVTVTILEETSDSMGVFNWGEEDLIGADIVMGPMQQLPLSKCIRPIRRSGAEHILISRVNDNLLRGNEHMRSIIPSPSYFIDRIADRVVSKHSQDNIIFLMAGGVESQMESQFYDLFKLDSLGLNSYGSDSLAFDTVHGSKISVGNLPNKLDFYKRNIVVSLASISSRSMLSNLQMVVQSNDSTEVFVYAHSDMQEIKFIDIQFLSRTRATVPSQGSVNWSDSVTIEAIAIYRAQYNTDPPKYALRAHDAMIDAFRRDLIESQTNTEIPQDSLQSNTSVDLPFLPDVVSTKCNWVQKYEFGGFVNSAWSLSTYHQDNWFPSETISDLPLFIIPELDKDGKYIKP